VKVTVIVISSTPAPSADTPIMAVWLFVAEVRVTATVATPVASAVTNARSVALSITAFPAVAAIPATLTPVAVPAPSSRIVLLASSPEIFKLKDVVEREAVQVVPAVTPATKPFPLTAVAVTPAAVAAVAPNPTEVIVKVFEIVVVPAFIDAVITPVPAAVGVAVRLEVKPVCAVVSEVTDVAPVTPDNARLIVTPLITAPVESTALTK
jgi:hypothetical protein